MHFDILDDYVNFKGETIVPFLDQLRRRLRGPIAIVWDGIPIHRAAPVRAFLKRHPTIVDELFPRYAPDLNPVDKIWFYVKFDCLPNFAPESLSILRTHVRAELNRLQEHPSILRSLFHMTRLSSALTE
jgi:hypothetical protein